MHMGLLIDYRMRIHGIPVRWQSEITLWDPPRRFVDEQRRGPYRLWIHEHTFEAEGNSTLVRDRVQYAVPGGWLVQRLFVGRDVGRIFAYRRQKLAEVFSLG
jgi:ligand-binding SRPBCC domain-containing protein